VGRPWTAICPCWHRIFHTWTQNALFDFLSTTNCIFVYAGIFEKTFYSIVLWIMKANHANGGCVGCCYGGGSLCTPRVVIFRFFISCLREALCRQPESSITFFVHGFAKYEPISAHSFWTEGNRCILRGERPPQTHVKKRGFWSQKHQISFLRRSLVGSQIIHLEYDSNARTYGGS